MTYQGEDQKKHHFLFLLSAKEVRVKEKECLLQGVDRKLLFMTARPGRCRAFIDAGDFLQTWIDHDPVFSKNLPRIAIIHSAMQEDNEGKAQAVSIDIQSPYSKEENTWIFDCQNFPEGIYRDVVFFIDWPAALECPKPIQLLLPSLAKDSNASK